MKYVLPHWLNLAYLQGETKVQKMSIWKASGPLVLFVVFATTVSVADQPRVAFVTSVSGNGNLSTWTDAGGAAGVAAGDAVCQARATEAGLVNADKFVAWLSDADDDAWCRLHGLTGQVSTNCGQQSLPQAAGPWVRTDGLPFAESIDLFIDEIFFDRFQAQID